MQAAGVNFVDGLICQGQLPDQAAHPVRAGQRDRRRGRRGRSRGSGDRGGRPGDRLHRVRWLRRTGPRPGPLAGPHAAGPRLRTGGRPHPELLHGAVHPHPADHASPPGEWVLVLGAGGGVGLAAVDVATALGGRVIAAASDDEKLAAASAMGAEATIALRGRGPEGPGPGALRRRRRRGHRPGGRPATARPPCAPPGRLGRFCVIGFASGDHRLDPAQPGPAQQPHRGRRGLGRVDVPGSRRQPAAHRRAHGAGRGRPAAPDASGHLSPRPGRRGDVGPHRPHHRREGGPRPLSHPAGSSGRPAPAGEPPCRPGCRPGGARARPGGPGWREGRRPGTAGTARRPRRRSRPAGAGRSRGRGWRRSRRGRARSPARAWPRHRP